MSGFEAALRTLSDRVRDHAQTISTEEAAKTSVVLPFLQALGYDVFNPAEVVPEYTADAVGKRGEKVDYAIKFNNEIQVLVECKGLTTKLDRKHLAQLFRYFTVTNARFAILTNGRLFEFYSDLEEPNKLDTKPFFVFDLFDFGAPELTELQKFEKIAFDVERILRNAERLKYVSAVKKKLLSEFDAPSDEFSRLVANEVYEGRITAQVKEQIGMAIKVAFSDIIRDGVNRRLSSALDGGAEAAVEEEELKDAADGIFTTEEEISGMLTVRAILCEKVAPERVDLRDAKSYCAVLLDNNNRKPLCRLHFNRKQWYLGLFDGDAEDRQAIENLSEIYRFSDRLKTTVSKYLED